MALQQISFAFDEEPVTPKPEPKAVVIEKPQPDKIKTKGDNKKLTRGRVSLKEKESGADLIEIPEDAVLFEKKYYAIGIVANMFRPEDIKNLKLIYHLLRERKYTMEGAKDFLKQNKRVDEKFALIESLKKLKGFLHELKADL
jgi:hypothetical protein